VRQITELFIYFSLDGGQLIGNKMVILGSFKGSTVTAARTKDFAQRIRISRECTEIIRRCIMIYIRSLHNFGIKNKYIAVSW
jgi:hypothetical protein